MNIFWLDNDPVIAASYHCDKHVVKMILESAQMLSVAQRILGNADERLYKLTHKNHPCSIWVRTSVENYAWLYEHFAALSAEYTFRYGKVHASYLKLNKLLSTRPPGLISLGSTEPALAMPDHFKFAGNPVRSYREYYKHKAKTISMSWKNREVPSFMSS